MTDNQTFKTFNNPFDGEDVFDFSPKKSNSPDIELRGDTTSITSNTSGLESETSVVAHSDEDKGGSQDQDLESVGQDQELPFDSGQYNGHGQDDECEEQDTGALEEDEENSGSDEESGSDGSGSN